MSLDLTKEIMFEFFNKPTLSFTEQVRQDQSGSAAHAAKHGREKQCYTLHSKYDHLTHVLGSISVKR